MPKPYDVTNWYWIVAGDATKVFSSAVGDYVPVSNPTYVAWLVDGTVPTSIDTEVNLGQVLAQALVTPANASVLDAYRSSQADTIVTQIIFKVLFNHENRIRTLAGQATINITQAKAAVKALL